MAPTNYPQGGPGQRLPSPNEKYPFVGNNYMQYGEVPGYVYNPKTRVCYGYVDLLEKEWGSFSLDELEAIKLPRGVEIEMDILWRPKTFSEARI